MCQKIKFFTVLLFIILIAAVNVKAQRPVKSKSRSSSYNYFRRADKLTLSASAGFSVMNSDNIADEYKSDVGYLKSNGYGPNISMGVMYQLSPNFGVLGNVEYVGFKGHQDEESYRPENSFTYRSNVISASGSVIISLGSRYSLSELYRPRFRTTVVVPYIKLGLGLMRYTASSFAEGQGGKLTSGTDYPDIAAFMPVGGGLRIRYSSRISFAPEFTFNVTSTDYLDNTYRNEGLTGNKDHFASASIKVFYTISRKRSFTF